MPDSLTGKSTNDAVRGLESIGRHGKQPLWSPEFVIPRTDRLRLVVAVAVQVPPLALVGDEIEHTIW